MKGGTMRISASVKTKCATLPIVNHKNTKTSATRFNMGVMSIVFDDASL
jgi:hypothetical protein